MEVMGLDSYLTAYDENDQELYDIAYWRKCYNIREAIYTAVPELDKKMTKEDLIRVKDEIEKITNKKEWDEAYLDGMTIWEWDDGNEDNTYGPYALMQLFKIKSTIEFWDSKHIAYVKHIDSY